MTSRSQDEAEAGDRVMTDNFYVTNSAWTAAPMRADTIDEIADQFERPAGAHQWGASSQRPFG